MEMVDLLDMMPCQVVVMTSEYLDEHGDARRTNDRTRSLASPQDRRRTIAREE
jgi:hypothetical protein